MRNTIAAVLLIISTMPLMAEENLPRGLGHPQPGEEHWYDRACCDRRDCEPVEPGGVTVLDNGDVYVLYKSSQGHRSERLFKSGEPGIRKSRDERDHVCEINGRPVCVYPKWQGG